MSDDLRLVNGKLLLTLDEASEYLGIGRSHLYSFVMRGELRSIKIGRSRRIPVYALPEFIAWLAAQDDPLSGHER